MAYDPDGFNTLRQAILDLITSKQTTIQEAYFEQRSEFNGSPVAVIGVSQNEALFNSTARDRMTFVFQILIYIPVQGADATHDVETRMGKAYWEVLHMFNQRGVLSPYADMVEPLPSSWGFEERGAGIYRFAEINLRCVIWMSNQPVLP